MKDCTAADLPTVRQAWTLWDDISNYIAEEVVKLTELEPSLKN